jgi:DegV family protein with EDD domain
MTVKVVTDSTSDLPQDLADSLGIELVPAIIHFGNETFKDGVDLSPDDFYERLTHGDTFPRTSQPSPGELVQIYERLGKEADAIVSIHISSKLSGTYNSAVQGSQEANAACPIEVIDSQQATLALGMAAIASARVANDGGSADEVAAMARDAASRSVCSALLDTLEYLQKGGRIGKAGAMLGSLLKIKPIIIIRDGEVQQLAKERTLNRALARLEQATRDLAPIEELGVMYSTERDDALRVAENLRDLLPEGKEPIIARIGPAIGAHAGPGAIGIGVLRAST